MARNDPTAHPKLLLTAFIAAIVPVVVLGVATGLLLNSVTDWPVWVTGGITGVIGGLTGPLITRWVMTRGERVRSRPSPNTEG
ncbi:hypothetical protein [Nocardiopsis tropica]|uniref:Uncharacterized protein n=1 Tax=Nocardiopsis tropica TaxID=109330 RepID=A0ABU7KWK1_9ACTN|nr:hypothetical protein [Nocardiopsis umidischolae]MEE2053645.1 hypothetical protein [Nocardiopsis umidischolae]